jgi:hypothetical protein
MCCYGIGLAWVLLSTSAFVGALSSIPGTIQIEDFDTGGEGVAYHDTTSTNLGGQCRPTEGVDIAASATASNGYLVGWTVSSEWLH